MECIAIVVEFNNEPNSQGNEMTTWWNHDNVCQFAECCVDYMLLYQMSISDHQIENSSRDFQSMGKCTKVPLSCTVFRIQMLGCLNDRTNNWPCIVRKRLRVTISSKQTARGCGFKCMVDTISKEQIKCRQKQKHLRILFSMELLDV